MSTENTRTSESVLTHHLESFANGEIDEILKDYSDDATIFTQDGEVTGRDNIKALYAKFFTELLPPGSYEFNMQKQTVSGNIAYIVWNADGTNVEIPLATDTFVFRDNKIASQTFAGLLIPK